MKQRKAQNPLTELREWLSESASRCRAMRWLGALFRVEVAQDIASDIAAHQRMAAESAHASEQYDLIARGEIAAARAELEAVLRADASTPQLIDAIVRLKKAQRMVQLSADRDHDISEALACA